MNLMRTLTLLLLVGGVSFATQRAESAQSRFYAGVGVGRSSVDGRAQAPARITLSPRLPADVPVSGLPFDDHDTAWSAFAGYAANDYLGAELGFWNHGTFDSRLFGQNAASLGIKEWYFGATLSYPLFNRLTLTGSAGVSRAQFDADGTLAVLILSPGTTFPPLPGIPRTGTIANLPLATPEDETGGYWRVGLNWRFSDSLAAGLNYGRRDLQVLQVETLGLSLQYIF